MVRHEGLREPSQGADLLRPPPEVAETNMSEDASTMLLGIGISSALLFLGAVVLFLREKSGSSLIQLVGAGGLLVVVAAHLSEALQLFPWMQWGLPHSLGHYVDLWSAVVGLTLFPVGYLSHALTLRRA